METTTPQFDLEAVYDEQIFPLMAQIIEICKREKMPMMASFCYATGRDEDDPDGRSYCTTALDRDGWQPAEIPEAVRVIRNGARSGFAAFTISKPA